jgi:hypothetical protein
LLPSYPPIPAELVEFTKHGKSLLVGTCSARGEPDCVRAVGLRVSADGCRLTVLVPSATGAVSLENLRSNPRLALTISHIPTHRTGQIKGKVVAVREGDDADRACAEQYREAFCEDLEWAGQPRTNTLRLRVWPCHAIDLEIGLVYAQTPGPVAGHKMPLATERP